MDELTEKALVILPEGGDEQCIDEAIAMCPADCIFWEETGCVFYEDRPGNGFLLIEREELKAYQNILLSHGYGEDAFDVSERSDPLPLCVDYGALRRSGYQMH